MRKPFLTITAVSTLLFACAGGDGADGAPGSAGTPGAPGASGAVGPTGPAGAATTTSSPGLPARLLDTRIGGWKDTNRDRLNKLLIDRGSSNASFDPKKRPVAVFDWDNTILKNDIGDATFFWMLKHDKIRQPMGLDWSSTNANLSAAGKAALNAACDGLAAPGDPLPTSSNAACANEIVSIYDSETTAAGVDAWTKVKDSKVENPYAWVAQLTAGWSPEDVRGFARAAYEENAFASIGATQTIGSLPGYTAWVRVYDQLADLIGALHANGFDVWITTASPQFFVDAISEMTVGVKQSHVLGIRNVLVNGVVTSSLQGCGPIADGANTIITFDEGKRCWINKVIYGEPPATQLPATSDPAKRPAFVAGDSDTDIAFLKDGADLKLVIDRNKPQVMCNALRNYMNKWIWEPMFINPKAPSVTYKCAELKDNNGQVGIVDEVGASIGTVSE
jgi:hypothetical protein